MVKEMKKVGEDLKSALNANQECLSELKKVQSKKRNVMNEKSE